MKTYKDIVKELFESAGFSADNEQLETAKDILVRRLRQKVPVKQFMFIEQNSVDLSCLQDLERSNPGVKIVIYKQGAAWPVLKDCK